jgi:hypothetical protein
MHVTIVRWRVAGKNGINYAATFLRTSHNADTLINLTLLLSHFSLSLSGPKRRWGQTNEALSHSCPTLFESSGIWRR